jgi:hypothetical protein
MTTSTVPAERARAGLLVPRPAPRRHAARRAFCGNLDRPGIELDNPAEIDYSRRPTSVDQARIEAWLRGADLAGKAVLHVGVGNSSLARGLAGKVRQLDGLTVHPNEKAHADSLGIPNYRVLLLNKHGPGLFRLEGRYDLIVDNNLASFACCTYHFHLMLAGYAAKLKPGGCVLTDERGMAWTADGNAGWKRTYEDLVALRDDFPFRAARVSETVFALGRVGRGSPARR